MKTVTALINYNRGRTKLFLPNQSRANGIILPLTLLSNYRVI